MAGEQFEYGFDDIGNRVSQKRGGDANGANLRSTTYAVNPLNQITSRAVVGSRYLDLIGLAEPGTTVTAGGVTASRRGEFWRAELNLGTGNPLWQSVNVTTSDGGSLANALYRVPPSSEVPTYDTDGNLTADGLWTYTWDAENRLKSMQSQAVVPTAGRRKLDFEYDPFGRRIGRVVSTGASGSWVVTSTTRWLYDGWNPVAELNDAGTLVREYVWGTDLSGSWQGAGGVGGLLWILEAPNGSNTAHNVAYDGNGNVMGLVNAADGLWSARYEYGPFGEVIRATGALAAVNPFRWSTKIQDEDTGLNYYGYRYYSAGVGRWLGRDPIEERGGINLTAFVRNAPNDFLDVLGLLGPADSPNFGMPKLPPKPESPLYPIYGKPPAGSFIPEIGARPTQYYDTTNLYFWDRWPAYWHLVVCCEKRLYSYGSKIYNINDVIKAVNGVAPGCKIVYFKISAHCNGPGGAIASRPNADRINQSKLSPDAISVDDFIKGIDYTRFQEGSNIYLAMCGSAGIAKEMSEESKGKVRVEGVETISYDRPGTESLDKVSGDSIEKCCSK